MVLGLIAATSGVARAQPLSSYFTIAPGTAPIVISAPHGGTLSYPFPERSCTGSEVCVLDTNTRQLALATRDEFFELTGLRPYVVVAQGSRRFIDFNRPAGQAYDSAEAAVFYDYYHDALGGFIEEIRQEFGRGLLIDIHGQSALPDRVIRGTKNGLTVSEMLGVDGEAALNGPSSLLGTLNARGLTADPTIGLPLAQQVENPAFDGGYTVQAHGSHLAQGLDAIQLEFGFDYRGGNAWQATAIDLAVSIESYLDAFLGKPFLAGDYNADGQVNAADYTSWRDAVGAPPGSLPNGVNGGVIGLAHYESWSNNYGSSATLPAQVPEAKAWMMAGTLLVGMAFGCSPR